METLNALLLLISVGVLKRVVVVVVVVGSIGIGVSCEGAEKKKTTSATAINERYKINIQCFTLIHQQSASD